MMIKSFTYLFIILNLEIAVCFSQVDLPFTEGVREIFISSAFFLLLMLLAFSQKIQMQKSYCLCLVKSQKKKKRKIKERHMYEMLCLIFFKVSLLPYQMVTQGRLEKVSSYQIFNNYTEG